MTIDIKNVFLGAIPQAFDSNAAILLAQQKAASLNSTDLINWFNNMVRNNSDGHLPKIFLWISNK